MVAGQRWKGDTLYHRVVVYEANGVDTLVEVASFEVTDGSTGSASTTLGDLNGDSVHEHVMRTASGLWVFRPGEPGKWDLFGHLPDPGNHQSVFAFDLNGNGRTEIVWASFLASSQTLILEYTSGAADAVVPGAAPAGLSVAPNPFRGEASIRLLPAAHGAATALVFDARGRLVHRQPFVPDAAGRGLLRVQHLQAGVYFVQVDSADRTPLGRGRAVVAPR